MVQNFINLILITEVNQYIETAQGRGYKIYRTKNGIIINSLSLKTDRA